jgi:hypothetical protein
MYELFLVVQYVKSLPSIEEYMISFVCFLFLSSVWFVVRVQRFRFLRHFCAR